MNILFYLSSTSNNPIPADKPAGIYNHGCQHDDVKIPRLHEQQSDRTHRFPHPYPQTPLPHDWLAYSRNPEPAFVSLTSNGHGLDNVPVGFQSDENLGE